MKERRYECRFCHKRFVHESRFLSHKCKQMKRDEIFRSTEGQAAWFYYQTWMKAYRRIVPNSKAFLQSKFFSSFVRFAKFVKKTHIPDVDSFIYLMKERDITPMLWTNDQVYSLYVEHLDYKVPPAKHAEITVNTLLKLADAAECDVGEVFDALLPNEVIQLLRERRLSPWLLIHSGKFREFFANKTSTEERIIMETIIRPSFWKKRFAENPNEVDRMQTYIEELNL